jgi:hypothetical protein
LSNQLPKEPPPKKAEQLTSERHSILKRIILSLSFVAANAAIAPLSLAQRQTAVGPGIIPLNAAGILGGVDMSASGTTGTLSVGVVRRQGS